MDNSVKVAIITQNNILDAVGLDFDLAFKTTERVLHEYNNGMVLYPDKVSQIFDEATQNRTNCLPATVFKEGISGVKWVSVFPGNRAKGLDNLSASILLSSTENGFPLAFMDGTICSNMRTAAVSTVAAKYLAKKNSETIGFVGAGQQARFHFLSIIHANPSVKKCFVSSRTEKSETKFIEEMSALSDGIEFVKCNSDYEKAVRNSDIVISVISGQEPIIQADWIGKGTLYLHVGGWEDAYDVPLKADKIVCDCWESVKHRTQTISRLYKAGRLADADIYADLNELVSKEKTGRENDDEFIYFDAVGLSYVDVALASRIYKICKDKNCLSYIEMQSDNVFSILNKRQKEDRL